MERNCNLKIKISKEIAEKYQLDPNTAFNAYFDGEHIVLKHLDKSKDKTKGSNVLDDDEINFWYKEGREKGLNIGYRVGYRHGYNDSKKDLPFNNEYPGCDTVLEENECADKGCEDCEHFCHHCGRCILEY